MQSTWTVPRSFLTRGPWWLLVAPALAVPALAQRGDAPQRARPPLPVPEARPVHFVENLGQWEPAARFVARAGNLTVRLEDRGLALHLAEEEGPGLEVRIDPLVDHPGAPPAGETRAAGVYNYLRGSDSDRWVRGAEAYESVVYSDVWPGVDLRLRSQDGHVEYDVCLDAGARLEGVVFACSGVRELCVDADGTLVLETDAGPIRQAPPRTWVVTEGGGQRVVACRYRRIDERHYGFVAEERGAGEALVIDPRARVVDLLRGDGL